MPQTFKIKSSSVEGKAPAAGDLATAELALNLKDQKLYSKDADGAVFEIGQAPDLDGFVKLDDEGNRQTIEGGGGLTVLSTISGNTSTSAEPVFQAAGLVSQPWNAASGYTAYRALNYNVDTFTVDTMGDVYIRKSLVIGNDGGGADEVAGELEVKGGVNAEFGDSTAQLGNVAPLNDWSCYPARA